MSKRILTVLGALLFLVSCQPQNEHEIPLFNKFKFHTDSTEKIAAIDSIAQIPYIQHFNNIDDIQIPLYRIVQGNAYTIYLGIPFHTNLKSIAAAKAAKPNADTVLGLLETPEYYYRQYKKGNLYLTEYMRNIDSASIICVFAATDKAQIASDALSAEKLSDRIRK